MVHSATVGKLKICVLKQKFYVQNARIENLTPLGASDWKSVVSPGISVCPSVLSSVHLSIFQSAIPLLYDALVEFYLCATNVESILARKCRFGTKNDQNRKSNAPTASRVAAHHANDSDEAYRCSHGGCVAQGCDPYPSPATRKGKDPPVCRQQR